MDQTARLIGEVAARYGIRLDPDDPAFALVALNQLALEDAVDQLAARLKVILAEIDRSAESVGLRAGIAIAEQIKASAELWHLATAPCGSDVSDERQHPRRMGTFEARLKWAAIGLVSGLLLFGLGMLVGVRVL